MNWNAKEVVVTIDEEYIFPHLKRRSINFTVQTLLFILAQRVFLNLETLYQN